MDEKIHSIIAWIWDSGNHEKDCDLAAQAILQNEGSLLAILRMAGQDKTLCETVNLHRLVKRCLRQYWKQEAAAAERRRQPKTLDQITRECLKRFHPDYYESKPEAAELLTVAAMKSLLIDERDSTVREPDLPAHRGLVWDSAHGRVRVDGKWDQLNTRQAKMWGRLWNAKDQRVPGPQIDVYAAQTKLSMPKKVRDEIDGDKHLGYCLKRFLPDQSGCKKKI